jgi:hypothetical protein
LRFGRSRRRLLSITRTRLDARIVDTSGDKVPQRPAANFYGTSEDRGRLTLPRAYGYPTGRLQPTGR